MTTIAMLSVPRGCPRWSRLPMARSGFSLIEMLVVLVLISAMAGIIAPRMRGCCYRRRMSRVDRDALKDGLDALQEQGLIQGWQARPLGMYMIHVLGDELLL